MKEYELTVLVHPDLEMNLEPATNKIEDLIKEHGGKIIKITNEGKKHLSYPIKGQEYAMFFFYELELPADAPAKMTNAFNISDEVIRYLLVSTDPRRAKAAAKAAEHTDKELEKAEKQEEKAEEKTEKKAEKAAEKEIKKEIKEIEKEEK